MDERALARKLNKLSRAALEQAIRQFTPYVGSVVYRTLSGRACREDVEEITADVFLALWNHAADIDAQQGLRAWLGTVARNKATDWLRCYRESEPILENTPDPTDGPEALAERREWSARLWEAVDTLPEPDRTLFLRYYYDGEKLRDVARDLGLSHAAAKQRLYRGRKALKARLAEGAETV